MTPSAKLQSGFVLPLVLWSVTALALIAAVITEWVNTSTEHTRLRMQEVTAARHMAEAQAIVFYQLSSQFISTRGVEIAQGGGIKGTIGGDPFAAPVEAEQFIGLDDRLYRWRDIEIRIQDGRGLINLNTGRDEDIARLLETYGIDLEVRQAMVAKLKDYIQPGETFRLNGAKTRQYIDAGRPPPRLAPLLTPFEAQTVLTWDEYPNLWTAGDNFGLATNVSGEAGLNLNTAPMHVLLTLPGFTPRAAEKFVAGRKLRAARGIQDVQTLSGVPLADDPLNYIFFPSNSFRITLRPVNGLMERLTAVRMTTDQLLRPWRIDYDFQIASKPMAHAADDEPEIAVNLPSPVPDPDLAHPQ